MTTSYDGPVRLYSVENKGLKLLTQKKIEGGKQPYSARFSPDSRSIAVGFDDTTVVQVLDATTLSEVARPSTEGVYNGDLAEVAWSADGAHLLAPLPHGGEACANLAIHYESKDSSVFDLARPGGN